MCSAKSDYITAQHIDKLEHEISEIRERALINVHTKIERGIPFDNEMARSKDLLNILVFKWFNKRGKGQTQHDGIALQMIKKIIESPVGMALVELQGTNEFIEGFTELKKCVEESKQGEIDALQNVLMQSINNIVPPLNLEDCNSEISYQNEIISSAKTIEGFVNSMASFEVDEGDNCNAKHNKAPSYASNVLPSPFSYFVFQWQWLIAADRHVLESVEETLRNPQEPSALLNSCEFFTDVLLHDFPAEVFLQRPSIIKQLHDLLWSSPSSRIATAILKCLMKLTKEFINRIRYYDDPNSHNLKLSNYQFESTPRDQQQEDDPFDSEVELIADTLQMMRSQMNIPQYCLNSIIAVFDYLYIAPEAGESFRRKKCLIGQNIALILLRDSITLFKLTVKSIAFQPEYAHHTNVETMLRKFSDVCYKFGEILTHYRIKVQSEDFHEEHRLIQIHLLANFLNLYLFLPANHVSAFLPTNLKRAISDGLLDPALSCLYPKMHEYSLEIAKSSTNDAEAFETYTRVICICKSMTAAVQFLREWKSLPFTKNVQLVKEALASLEYHRNMAQISCFADLCANKLTMHSFDQDVFLQVEDIWLRLLSHVDNEIRLEAYKCCQKKVVKTVGAKLNISKSSSPGSQLLFLLRPKLLCTFAVHGTQDLLEEVQTLAEDIILHIMKCKILVSEEIWQEAVTSLLPVFPILITQLSKDNSLIGRNVLSVLDPDRSRLLSFAFADILRLNTACLFVKNGDVRLEAISRLCWLLSTSNQSNGGDNMRRIMLLPHLNNLHDKALSMVCLLKRPVDFKLFRSTQTHFYQSGSLKQIIDLLSSKGVEPVIRRSAITQMSVMLEDPILHSTFLEHNGLELIKETMYSALIENDYENYPDSIVPCLAALKHLSLYSSSVRQQLSQSDDYLSYILRGVFLFCTEDKIKQDGAILLFLIAFSNYIQGSPMRNDFSIPHILHKYLQCPFDARTHWKNSEYAMESYKDLKENKWALSALQIHWNIVWFNDIDCILKASMLIYKSNDKFSDLLKLNASDLSTVQNSSLECVLHKHLALINESHNHIEISKSIHIINICLYLYEIVKVEKPMDLTLFEWERSFGRFLNSPPAGQDDNILLTNILQLLSHLLPYLTPNSNFIIALLTNRSHYFTTILSQDVTPQLEPDEEKLINTLMHLINVVAKSTQSLMRKEVKRDNNSYIHIIRILVSNLRCNSAQEGGHLYNLAYLDRLLLCLVNLTANLGWSETKPNQAPTKLLEQLAEIAFELLRSFNSGKGPTAPYTLMGLSITRNVVLILNHLLAEVQHFNVNHWEDIFITESVNEESIFVNIFNLYQSRDVALRAAALHLLSGLAISARTTVELIRAISKCSPDNFWKVSLKILCDQEEASIVRENTALLLANISSHTTQCGETESELLLAFFNKKIKVSNSIEQCKILRALFDACDFINAIEMILRNLYLSKRFNLREHRDKFNEHSNTDGEDDFIFIYNGTVQNALSDTISDSINHVQQNGKKIENAFCLTTPGLVKTMAMFLYNLINVMPHFMCTRLQEQGLIKWLFKCVSLPSIDIEHGRDFIFYSDLLEMNAAICTVLTRAASLNSNCLLTIGNARDCLDIVTSLLDPALYVVSLPQLLYLRNKLWTNIYQLLEILLINDAKPNENSTERTTYDKNAIIMQLEDRKGPFFLSLCESISTDLSNDLQLSALNSFTCLLKCSDSLEDVPDLATDSISARSSIQTLLDTTSTTPKSSARSDITKSVSKINKLSVLGEVYFGPSPTQQMPATHVEEGSSLAGAELCRLLLELYEVLKLEANHKIKKKQIVLNTLSGLLTISNVAKQYALENAFMPKVIEQIKQIYVQLSLESVDCLRKVSDRKRLTPLLDDLESFLGLLMNFMHGSEIVKESAAKLGLADLLHKLWHWLSSQKYLLILTLKLLCTLSSNSAMAVSSLALTSSMAGSAPRKTPNNASLLHILCTLILKEMELVSRTHSLEVLELSFQVLLNAMEANECRFIIVKSNFLHSFVKLHPALTKRQKPWETVEFYWLQFIEEFTAYTEGQSTVGKMQDIFDIVLLLCGSPNEKNRFQALSVVRNIAFHQGNRSRLIGSDDFLNVISGRFTSPIVPEISLIISTVWALAANCQKAKMVFKCAGLDQRIIEFLRMVQLGRIQNVPETLISNANYVLNLIQEGSLQTLSKYS